MVFFAQYLLLMMVALASSYALGWAIVRGLARSPNQEPYAASFLALLTGLTTIVVSYAIARTGGHTVLLPVIGLLALLLWYFRHPSALPVPARPPAPVPATVLWHVVVVAIAVYAGRFLLLYDPASPFLRTPFQDYIFYARISMPLNELGIESNTLERLFPQFVGAQPYHYFSLWFNALLVKITDLPGLWCLYLVVYSTLITLVATGLRALLACFRLPGSWAWVLTGLLLLVSGVCWPLFSHYKLTANGQLVASSLLLLEPKLATVYVFLLLGMLLLVQQRFAQAGLAFAILPLAYVSVAPAVGGGIVLLGLYLWITRRTSRAEAIQLVVPIILAVGYFGAFYLLQHKAYAFPEPTKNAVNEVIPKVAEARVLLNIFIGVLLNYTLYFGAYALVVAAVASRRALAAWLQLTPTLVLALLLAVLAAGMCTLGTHYSDGYQFSSNVVAPLLPIVLAVVLGAAFATASASRKGLSALLLATICAVNYYPLLSNQHSMHKTTRYSPAFLREVQASLPKLGNRGAFLLADVDYENTYMLSQDTYTAGTYVADFTNNYALAALSSAIVDSLGTDARYSRDSVQARHRLQSSTFYRYLRLKPRHRAPLDSLQYRFVSDNGIRFICASPNAALPATLRPLVAQTLADPLSGEKFYALRPVAKRR